MKTLITGISISFSLQFYRQIFV